nr:OF72 bro-d [Lymantria dispar multiple nucleopolyhedrovirus]
MSGEEEGRGRFISSCPSARQQGKRRSRPSLPLLAKDNIFAATTPLPPLIARPLLESIGRVSCVHNIIDNFAVNNF